MKQRIRVLFTLCTFSLYAVSAWADVVHVTYQISAGGTVATVAETTLETGYDYTTIPAPAKGGYLFTYWSSSEPDPLVMRDAFGRALDAARFTLYQDVTLTANYVPAIQDTDGDGVPDGYELYWYGDLAQGTASDTDGDGATFAEELACGTNPLFPDTTEPGGVSRTLSNTFLYNPHGYAPVIVRSEPEGKLCTTTTNYCSAGDLPRTPTLSVADGFAYWTVDGAAQRDAFGRALDQVVVDPDAAHVTEVVAHYVADEATRWALYWYGRSDVAMDSDTDGDGYTFAEELANGTNPHFPDTSEPGDVSRALSDTFLYNPHGYAPVVVRSDPEGALFATATNYVTAGDIRRTDTPSVVDGFAYWTVDGVEQRDAFGRALDQAVVTPDSGRVLDVVAHVVDDEAERLSYYWYGRPDVAMDSDTDGDGYTFAEEIANGTNPLMPDSAVEGPIAYADSETLEANLQPFDPATGAVVDDQFDELFTSPFEGNDATSRTFGPNARPVVTDVNGDGLFDLVILYDGGYAVYLNGGTAGNPMFTRAEGVSTNGLDLAQGSLTALDGLTLDVPPTGAVSCAFGDVDQDGIVDLLVSDAEGRIWFYKRAAGDVGPYHLQHKVWAGSHAGFAPGLTIALVDWDGDGDLDCVCGTADGKLMLLVDPRVGKPTNVQAMVGVDSVVLTWDPNGNSRVRGYGIYRGVDTNAYDRIEALWPLPRYRDVPETIQDYYYRVTSLSRFYTSGNSTPTISESLPTDAVYVQFRPSVWLTGASAFTGSNVTVVVSMNNTMGISAKGLTMTFTYDPAVLEPVGMRTTGLTAGLVSGGTASVPSAGTWRFTSLGGEIATGAGRFLLLDFTVRPVHDVDETTVTLKAATVKALDGRTVALDLPKSVTIEISDSNPLVPTLVAVHVADASVTSETEFELPVTVTSTEALTNFMAEVTWDTALLEFRGVTGGTVSVPSAGGTDTTVGTAMSVGTDATERVPPVSVTTTGGDFALRFYAKDPASAVTNFTAHVGLTNIVAVDCHDFAVQADDAMGTVLIRNAHPWVPAHVSISTEDRKVETLETVTVPFRVTSDVALTRGMFTVTWDEDVLELRDIVGGTASVPSAGGTDATERVPPVVGDSDATSCVPPVVVTTEGDDFALTFLAKNQHVISQTQVRLTAADVTDVHGFVVSPKVPVIATVLIHDAHPLVPAQVAMTLEDVHAKTETEFEMTLAVSSTEALTNLTTMVEWDATLLELRGVTGGTASVPSAGGTDATERVPPASGNADATSCVPPVSIATEGGGFTLRFYAKENHTVDSTQVTVRPQGGWDHNGLAAVLPSEVKGTVVLADSNPWKPATASVGVGVGNEPVDTRTEFEVPVKVTSNERLTNFTASVAWDTDVLEWRGVQGGTASVPSAGGTDATERVPPVSGDSDETSCVPPVVVTTEGDDFVLKFYVKDQHDVTRTIVQLTGMTAVDEHGLTANAIADAEGTVLIHDAHPLVPAQVAVGVVDTRTDTLQDVSVPVRVTTTKPLTNLVLSVGWDTDALEWRGVQGGTASVPSAGGTDATERVPPVSVTTEGVVHSDATERVPPVVVTTEGGGFVLKFYAKDQHAVTETAITLGSASAWCEDGLAAVVTCTDGRVFITDANPPVAPNMTLGAWSVRVLSGEAFQLPIGRTSDGELADLTVSLMWDKAFLTFDGAVDATKTERVSDQSGTFTFATQGLSSTNYLAFTAHTIRDLRTNVWVTVTAGGGTGANGLAARVKTAFPLSIPVLIVREIGKYSPGDIDGDGKLTDKDMEKLQNFLKYESLAKVNPTLANRYAAWKLTGKALAAADVNGDGKVDVNDVSLLKQWIEQAKEMDR